MNKFNFSIMTEVTCDLPADYILNNGIITMPLTYMLDEVEYDGTIENSLEPNRFYELLRGGKMAKTAQVPPEKALEMFKVQLDKGFDILYIGFSSGLSGSFQSATIAKAELAQQYPNRKLLVVDSLCASLGQGMLVELAVSLREKGDTIDEVAVAAANARLHICHYFTVNDLNHLYRGGRVSKATALFGTILGIKPLMHVDNEGKLIAIGKIRGRRQSLDALVEKMGTKLGESKNEYVFVSHGDCIDDAKYVAEKAKKAYGCKLSIINYVGPVIGSHSGPGTVALFFIGTNRDEKAM